MNSSFRFSAIFKIPCALRLLVAGSLLLNSFNYAAAQYVPQYRSVDHVEFFVTNLERSLAFYAKLFGNELWKNKNSARRYLPLGTAYIALEQREQAKIEHLCFGIDDFDIDQLHQYLAKEGLPWKDYPSGLDLHVDDRDGSRVQLAQNHTWEEIRTKVAAIESPKSSTDSLFHPIGLDEVYIQVTNLEVDSLHYARLLGQTGKLQAGSLWFVIGSARLRLSQAPVGQSPGINYFSVLVSQTDLENAAEAVFKAGGIIENILPNGFSFWDPDGLRVEVHVVEQFLSRP